MFNIAAWVRPFFGAVVLTAILLTAGGIYSALRMPSGIYPEVTFPRIAVVARKPGLSLTNMEVQVTRPLEEATSTVLGVNRVRSKTIRGGCDLSIDFVPGTDIRRAEQLTWNRIGAARGQMPPDIELTVEQMTPSVFPIISVVLTGGESPDKLRDYAFYQLAPAIKNIPDVLYANVSGGDLREIEVEARPDDLLACGLSAADLADQIGKAHRLEPIGRVERPPFAFQILVNTQGETAHDIEELVISNKANQPVRVRDVADVKVSHQDRTNSVGYGGEDAVVVTVFRRLGGNTGNISRDIHDLLKRRPAAPANIKAAIGYDQSRFIDTSVHNVRDAIIVGSLFSVLILLAFLRSWRATLVAALALPTTLAITFLFLSWVGETLNLMSLGGLAVAIGLIIDDTVVVIENIARHLAKRGRSTVDVSDPVVAASGEITGAVVGSTLTTVLVFIPLAFIAGVYGQFFASLSWSLSIAVLVSMFISLTLVPVCAARFLGKKPMPEPGPIYNFLADSYERVLSVALRFPWVTLGLSFAAIGLGALIYTGVPNLSAAPVNGKPPVPLVKGLQTGLMPAMDEGRFILDYFAPTGTPLEGTEAIARDLEHILDENPDVEVYVRRAGSENGLFATQTSRGDIQVVLRPDEDDPVSLVTRPVRPKFSLIENELKEAGKRLAAEKYGPKFTEKQQSAEGKAFIRNKYRRRPLEKVMEEVEDEIKDHFSEHQLKFELIQLMQDELNDLSGSNRPIEVKLFGPDYKVLRELAEKSGDAMEKRGKGRGLKEVNTHVLEGNPDLMVTVDGVKAARMGISAQEVERQLRTMYIGQSATQLRESSARITNVRVRYADARRFGAERFSPDLLLDQWILLPEGAANPTPVPGLVPTLSGPARMTPLSALADVKRQRTPDEQIRENQQPAVIVSAELNESEAGLGAVVGDVRESMKEVTLPPGYRWELGGHYLKQQEAFRSLALVMAVAIFLVFILLSFQFRSVFLPILIFMTQPLSLVSGLFALWVTNTPLNVSSYMGMVLLIGLDVKNGILLVEYIQQLREEGMGLHEALLLAGRTRFRPILMTSLAAILGLLPLALGIGPGAQMQQPLAIMVIGGLTANMLFTRLVIPAGYLVFESGWGKFVLTSIFMVGLLFGGGGGYYWLR